MRAGRYVYHHERMSESGDGEGGESHAVSIISCQQKSESEVAVCGSDQQQSRNLGSASLERAEG